MSSRAKIRAQPYFSSYLNRRITRSSGSVCRAMASMRSMWRSLTLPVQSLLKHVPSPVSCEQMGQGCWIDRRVSPAQATQTCQGPCCAYGQLAQSGKSDRSSGFAIDVR